ncbi:MAG TPA: ATP-binding protein [Thermoanaerobaculia bacterium]|nr:ATP-binding protein [Thermoanaerobaculia bacterium]
MEKEGTESVEARLEDLERREIEQAQFIADVSHELRTPLTILRGGIEVAIDGERTADEYRQALSEALVEVQHLIRIAENLLFLARGTAGRVTISFARIDLRRFAEERVREFETPALEKGLELTFEAPARSVEILADRSRLKEVFQNLLENAIRYTEKGHVRVRVGNDGPHALIEVEDTGVGIEPQDVPYVFDRFFRSDRARRAYKGGSGLGLSIVRWIVEAHKGTVAVESRPGHGTTFSLRFPRID